MTLEDWRRANPDGLTRHYERERAWWWRHLRWDTREAWREVEEARRTGRLPGLMLVDRAGRTHGLAYGLVDEGVGQVGPLVADHPDGAIELLAGILATSRAGGATEASYFGPGAPHIDDALTSARFSTHRYLYLTRKIGPVDAGADASPDLPWSEADVKDTAVLLHGAYGPSGRHFAPHGRIDQWKRYVRNLVAFTGCGTFDPRLTRIQRDGAGLAGVALVTAIGEGVAHLAQLAVRPDLRGQGRAKALVDDVVAAAGARGYQHMTLLVDEAAASPRRVYASRGFTESATFISGWLTH